MRAAAGRRIGSMASAAIDNPEAARFNFRELS